MECEGFHPGFARAYMQIMIGALFLVPATPTPPATRTDSADPSGIYVYVRTYGQTMTPAGRTMQFPRRARPVTTRSRHSGLPISLDV